MAINLTGEHFSSATGKELDKKFHPYVRFRWEDTKQVRRATATILEKEKIVADGDLSKELEGYYGCLPKVCVICAMDRDWPLVRFEFYNWKKPDTEKDVFAHVRCLEGRPIGAKLDTLKTFGKNPTFIIELNCLSIEKCARFSKASDFRNCEHIVLRFEEIVENNGDGSVTITMSPLLHCKRAHPGEFFLEAEKDTFWNVEDAGLALLAKRIQEQLETPEVQGQLNVLRKQHPELVEAYRKLIREQPVNFAHSAALYQLYDRIILAKTPDELWDEVVQGNDYY